MGVEGEINPNGGAYFEQGVEVESTQVEAALNWASLVGTPEGRGQLEKALGREGVVVAICVHFTNHASPTVRIDMLRGYLGGNYTDEEIILALKNSKFRLLSARCDEEYYTEQRQALDKALSEAKQLFDAYVNVYPPLGVCWGNTKKIQQLIAGITPNPIGVTSEYQKALQELLDVFIRVDKAKKGIVSYAKVSKNNPPVHAARPLDKAGDTVWKVGDVTIDTDTIGLFVRGREEDGLGQIGNSFGWISAGTPLTEAELSAAKPEPETHDGHVDTLGFDNPPEYGAEPVSVPDYVS